MALMEIQLATERLFVLEDRLTAEDAEQRANEKRMQAFGGGIGSLLQRPKPEDIVIVARQRRLEPFWHVSARAEYIYERQREYAVPGSAPEVQQVTIEGKLYELEHAGSRMGVFRMAALEHCRDEFVHDVYLDGVSGVPVPDGATIVDGPRKEISDPTELAADGTLVLPPEQRASFVVRKALAEVMKPVQADRILQESVALDATDLFYRPVWAFEYSWQGRGKSGVIEVDTATAQVRQGKPLLGQIRGIFTRDVLFDVGADTVGLIVPGGSIAVKLAKAAIDRRQ
jgi:hypothetical protein